jgi:archaemetzincin
MLNYKTHITICLGIVFIITVLIIVRYNQKNAPLSNSNSSADSLFIIWEKQLAPEQSRSVSFGNFRPLPKPWHNDWLALHSESGQTFEQFISGNYYNPDSMRQVIYLQPFWQLNEDATSSLDLLAEFTQCYFAMPVRLLPPVFQPKSRFAPRQNPFSSLKFQVHTDSILVYLRNHLPDDAFCILGITNNDLYPDPAWNYVFGCASWSDRVGVFSLARLGPVSNGEVKKNGEKNLLLLRSCKILSHEAGHLFGMEHCIFYHCTMNGSNNLQETDAQPVHLCPVCLRKLHHVLGFDVNDRYGKLHTFYSRNGLEEQAQWVEQRQQEIQQCISR